MSGSMLRDAILHSTLQKYLKDEGRILFSPNEDTPRGQLRADAEPFCPRPQEEDFPDESPPLFSNLPMFSRTKPSSEKTRFAKQLDENKLQEATVVNCIYCSSTHQGPHCYEGGCDTVMAVCPSSDDLFVTKEVCKLCRGRHFNSPHFGHNDREVFCKICQRRHPLPYCQDGETCFSSKNRYYCDTNHAINQCDNHLCYLYKIKYSDFANRVHTKFICIDCGGRHQRERPAESHPRTVDCKFCRKRHLFPPCLDGNCDTLRKVETPLAGFAYHPLVYPETKRECSNCGRRHKESYGFYRGKPDLTSISCLSCGSSHSPPACSLGECGEFRQGSESGLQFQTTKKYLCNLCGQRHRSQPQNAKGINDESSTEHCSNCDKSHKPGACYDNYRCGTMANCYLQGKTPTTLECPDCGMRHISMSRLIRKTKVNAVFGDLFQGRSDYVNRSNNQFEEGPVPTQVAPLIPQAPITQPIIRTTFCRHCNKIHQIPFCRPVPQTPNFGGQRFNFGRRSPRGSFLIDPVTYTKLNTWIPEHDPKWNNYVNNFLETLPPDIRNLLTRIYQDKHRKSNCCQKTGLTPKELTDFFTVLFATILRRFLF